RSGESDRPSRYGNPPVVAAALKNSVRRVRPSVASSSTTEPPTMAAISAGRAAVADGRPVLTSAGSAEPSPRPPGSGAAGTVPPARVSTRWLEPDPRRVRNPMLTRVAATATATRGRFAALPLSRPTRRSPNPSPLTRAPLHLSHTLAVPTHSCGAHCAVWPLLFVHRLVGPLEELGQLGAF